MRGFPKAAAVLTLALGAAAGGCAKKVPDVAGSCAKDIGETVAGPGGEAFVFVPDPMTSAGNLNLSPSSLRLDDFRTRVAVERLGGRGVLEGQYVDIRNGVSCKEGFGAQASDNLFLYSHSDPRFQEAMSYVFGDRYRHSLDAAGYLMPLEPVRIVAHCELRDNAYYIRGRDMMGRVVEKVCLGDSQATPGASYADDAAVLVHELQHATTVNTYSPVLELNRYWYDEAGAINEAISDFMALIFLAPDAGSLDPRLFSRWALGTFIPQHVGTRGTHKCPVYDSDYPNCGGFRSDASGFSAGGNTVSYVYPDGLGWPYANNFRAPGYVKSAFTDYGGQEEIHNAGMIVAGALWDVYEALKSNRGGDASAAYIASARLVHETIRHLPMPTPLERSPVTFRELGQQLVSAAGLLSMPAADVSAITAALTARGLVGGPSVPAGWAAAGPGEPVTPGVRIKDNPLALKAWLLQMGFDPSLITQGVGTKNDRLDPGEVVAIWFDVRNTSVLTAGGLQVTITSESPYVTFPATLPNDGAISDSQVQIRYGKVNGSAIVAALTSSNPSFHVPTGTTYFLTNPAFGDFPTTAVWLKVAPEAPHGQVANLKVEIVPTNGAAATVDFPVTIQ
jgi:hypothetical protein